MYNQSNNPGPQTLWPKLQSIAQQHQQRLQQVTQQQLKIKWMWNGEFCDIQDFATKAYGDTAERTYFLLKYSKGE